MTERENVSEREHGSHIWVNEIKENDRIHGLYLAKIKKSGTTKKGDPFLSILLSDRTGDVESRVWENAEEFSSIFKEGDILEIEGHAGSYRNQIQLIISDMRAYDGNGDPTIFLESTAEDIAAMMKSLRELLKRLQDTHLKALSESFLADHLFIKDFKKAPAAKNFHHNYVGGLLEHTLSVCRMSQIVAEQYRELERDLLITGAFLHDIGKIREFRYNRMIEYTDEGRLLGHLVMGISMVDEKLSKIKPFPMEKALRLKHLILSHHGQYEFGSPKRPKFLEAFALHLIDDLDAKMNGLRRYMEKDNQEGAWTDFNRMFERYLLKNKLPEVETRADYAKQDDRQKSLFMP